MRLALNTAVALAAALSAPSIAAPGRGAPLGGCTLRPVLMEEFNEESIHTRTIGPARWTAHKPIGGDFGDARFTNPGPGGPFLVRNGVLSITASKDKLGRWSSGLIAAADASGAGAGAQYGYFETRMKIPPGPGTWPAFWLLPLRADGVKKDTTVEIDVIEYYGHIPDGYRSVVHVWSKNPALRGGKGQTIKVPSGSLVSGYHVYGVDVSPQAIVFFLDGKRVWTHPTPKELDEKLYPLVNLALGSGFPITKTPNPSVLKVDYVHVYERGRGPPGGCPPGPSQDRR